MLGFLSRASSNPAPGFARSTKMSTLSDLYLKEIRFWLMNPNLFYILAMASSILPASERLF